MSTLDSNSKGYLPLAIEGVEYLKNVLG
jgi:hypothetical protein